MENYYLTYQRHPSRLPPIQARRRGLLQAATTLEEAPRTRRSSQGQISTRTRRGHRPLYQL